MQLMTGRRTRRDILVATFVLGAALATDAAARDVCTTDRSNTFVFKRMKHLRPGDAVPLIGRYQRGALIAVPFDGTAVMRADGSVTAGIFVHDLVSETNNFTLEWTTDATLAGIAKFDRDGDMRSDGTLDLRSVDCGTLLVP